MSLKGGLDMNIQVDKSCKTCEFLNNNGKCIDDGHYGYGCVVDDFETQMLCWSIGSKYFCELLDKLPERTQQEIQRGFRSLNEFFDIK